MTEKVLVHSEFSRRIDLDGTYVRVEIFRLQEESEWTLEVIDETGASTVWDGPFASESAALEAAMKVIRQDGIRAFLKPQTP